MRIGLLALLLACSGAAQAAVFVFDLTGTGTNLRNPYDAECATQDCTQPVAFDWTGTLTITTADTLDGLHTGAALTSIDFASAVYRFHLDGFGRGSVQGWYPAPTVTMLGGQPVALLAKVFDPIWLTDPMSQIDAWASWDLTGGGAHLSMRGWHMDQIEADGKLSPVVAPVPEPATGALLLLGLLLCYSRLTSRTIPRKSTLPNSNTRHSSGHSSLP